MKFGFVDTCLKHDPGRRHPENPDRIRAIRRRLQTEADVEYSKTDPATREQLLTVHSNDYLTELQEFCEEGGGNWDADTIATEETWDAALASAGLGIWAAKTALHDPADENIPFSLGRPPGHHATEGDAMGFCFFNNIAIATEAILETVDRVAIFDWDVHHGNGTQEIFYDRSDVFYASIHEEGLYPGTGDIHETGESDGIGTTLNAPVPAGVGDGEYTFLFDEIIKPAILRFEPNVLLISAGFDAHRHDPISRTHVSTEGFGHLAARIRDIVAEHEIRLGFILEGGYSLDTLAESVVMVNDVFTGTTPTIDKSDPDQQTQELVATLRDVHSLG